MKTITSILELPLGQRIVNHYRKYCADNGANAFAILIGPDGREYCVQCHSALNAAGNKIMGEQ